MKKMFYVLLLAVIAPLALFAGEALPGEANPILASENFTLNGQTLKVDKRVDDMNVTIRVTDAEGKQVFTSESLGSEEKLFVIDRQAKSLAVSDLDGDGVEELITAAFYGPNSSGLYVFKYNASNNSFAPIPFVHAAYDLTRDFLVSDLRQANGEDLMFLANDVVRALGLIYPEDAESEPVAGHYFYKLSDNTFKFIECKPVPTDD